MMNVSVDKTFMLVAEKAGGQETGWKEEEADPEVHPGLHSPC